MPTLNWMGVLKKSQQHFAAERKFDGIFTKKLPFRFRFSCAARRRDSWIRGETHFSRLIIALASERRAAEDKDCGYENMECESRQVPHAGDVFTMPLEWLLFEFAGCLCIMVILCGQSTRWNFLLLPGKSFGCVIPRMFRSIVCVKISRPRDLLKFSHLSKIHVIE